MLARSVVSKRNCDLSNILEAPGSDLRMMKDLAGFMERRAPSLLEEFVVWREFQGGEESVQRGRVIQQPEEEIVRDVVDSFKKVIDTIKINDYPPETVKTIFSTIFRGIQSLLPNGAHLFQRPASTTTTTSLPAFSLTEDISEQGLSQFAEWPHICRMLWYPYQREKCGEARCLACAPAMMASAQVCRLTEGRVTRQCVERSLQSKYCNFCIRKYVHA